MTDTLPTLLKAPRNILEYLQSLRCMQGAVEVQVRGERRNGSIQVRQGQVFAAQCGSLVGNGAFLTLVAMGNGDVIAGELVKPYEPNVSVTVAQVEYFFAKLPCRSQAAGQCDEERTYKEAIDLFYQFRRREAAAKLVEVLRSNRFYYPAWLWYSRLMTREDHIKKALNEAGKWGNADPEIRQEVQKIVGQGTGSAEKVARCLFCWSLVGSGQACCTHCGGLQRVATSAGSGTSVTEALHQALARCAEAMRKNPRNSRIAYCLCLGFCSLGQIGRARSCINVALKISPREPLFVRAAALLHKQVEKHPVAGHRVADQEIKAEKTVLVVEDSRTARKVISMVLGRKRYKILEATSGTETLLAIEGMTPDLVLLDVMLPDMSGYEVLSAIRKNRELCRVPVVMLTSKRDVADRQKGLLCGASEYLTKPFDPVKLLGVLGKYLDSPTKTAAFRQAAAAPRQASLPSPAHVAAAARPVVCNPKPIVVPTAVLPKKNGLEKSILVVEDSPTSRKVITMVLLKMGYLINEAACGEVALRKVHEQPPHLILLDAMLPDMTGYDILAKLQEDPRLKGIPVVMLTAKDSPIDREKGLRAGAVAYLTKPFNPDKLHSVIGGFL
jgi:twitching motility two-component system response regulator PilG